MQKNSVIEWMKPHKKQKVRIRMIQQLKEIRKNQETFTAVAGFDVVVDTVVRLIRKKDKFPEYFETIEEFGNYLSGRNHMSCSIEMEVQQEKIGGNMAIFANCLGNLGAKVDCIGSMGYPDLSPFMSKMNPNCRLHSVCDPGQCNALEFHDGKVMLYGAKNLKELTWEGITDKIPKETLKRYFAESSLAALLNWGELYQATELFSQVFRNCITQEKNKWLLIDLSDASGKTQKELAKMVDLCREMNRYRTIIFSTNENECRLLYRLLVSSEEVTQKEMTQAVARCLGVDYFVLHLREGAYGVTEGRLFWEEGYYTKTPKISTGGGDNFNAGLCFSMVQGIEFSKSLRIGNAVSGYYVRTGKSPDLSQLIDFMEKGRWIP